MDSTLQTLQFDMSLNGVLKKKNSQVFNNIGVSDDKTVIVNFK